LSGYFIDVVRLRSGRYAKALFCHEIDFHQNLEETYIKKYTVRTHLLLLTFLPSTNMYMATLIEFKTCVPLS